MATNITIFAIEDSFDSWEVHVSWARPDVLHDLYNVSLWMDEVETQRIILPGVSLLIYTLYLKRGCMSTAVLNKTERI